MGLFDILKCCIPIFESKKNAREKHSRPSAASIPDRSYSGAGIKMEPLLSLPPKPQEMREDQDSIPQAEAPKEEIVQTAPQQRSVSAAQDTAPQATGREALPRLTTEIQKAKAVDTAALRSYSSAETSALSLPPPPPPPAVARTVAPKAAKQEEPQAKSILMEQILEKRAKLKKAKLTQNSDTKAAVEDTQILTPEIYKKFESADYTALSRFIDEEKKLEDPSLEPTQQQQPDEKQVESEIDSKIEEEKQTPSSAKPNSPVKEQSVQIRVKEPEDPGGVYEVFKSSRILGKVKFVKDSQDLRKIDKICNTIFKQIGVPYIIFGNTDDENIVVLKYGGGLTTDKATAIFLGIAAERSRSEDKETESTQTDGMSCISSMVSKLSGKLCCTMTNPKVLLFFQEYFTVRTAWHEKSHNNQANQLGEETARNLLKLNGKGIFPMDLHNILVNENNMDVTILECVPPKDGEREYCRIKLMNGKTYFVRLQYNSSLAETQENKNANDIPEYLVKCKLILEKAQSPFLKQVFKGAATTLAKIAGLEKSQQIESVEIIKNGNWVSYRENLRDVYVPGMITSDIFDYILSYIDSVLLTVRTDAEQKFGKTTDDDSVQNAIEFARKLHEEWMRIQEYTSCV